ncbi:MAG: hypothetical protein C0425_10045 [Chlorobiaceae bacterium]|nr:hypothetical protein [Chlorobiaceae bacterium]
MNFSKTIFDTRFLSKPQQAQYVPLYEKRMGNTYELSVSPFLNLSTAQLLLTESATTSLLTVIAKIYNRTFNRVAIPSFFCHRFATALLSNAFDLILYEYDWQQNLSQRSADFIVAHNAEIIIIPQLFGARPFPFDLIQELLNLGKVIVLDQAQTFPFIDINYVSHENLFTLFSFGRNKPLAIGYGGGIYAHGKSIPCCVDSSVWHNQIIRDIPFMTDMKDWLQDYFSGIDLIDKVYEPFTNLQNLSFQWTKLNQRKRSMHEFFLSLQQTLPEEILSFFQQDIYPSVLVLSVPNRYDASKYFAERGIETTWYYYPLSLLDKFSDFPCEPSLKTLEAAQLSMVFPFSINHTDQQLEYCMRNISSYFNTQDLWRSL